ncbi:MAG: hypothetical protein WKF30_03005 [Pyrinomonadaceae bacterium]
MPARITGAWLAERSPRQARALLGESRMSRRPAPPSTNSDVTRPGEWCRALGLALDGESRADVLLAGADIDYLLSFRDAVAVAPNDRADVALFLRDALLELSPDGSLEPKQAMSRARVLRMVARTLDARGLLALQKATARPSVNGALVLRAVGRGADRSFSVALDAFLFRAFGERAYPALARRCRRQPVVYHANAQGQIDYLEVRPAANGAASDRFSPFSHWTTTLTAAQVVGRLFSGPAAKIGALADLRVAERGASRRATDLEIIGTGGTAHVRGGRVRSALGLREQLFVIEQELR